MPEATGPASKSIILIDLRGTATAGVSIPADVMGYFGITPPTTGVEEMKVVNRDAYTRKVYKGLTDTVGTASTVRASTWETPVKAPKGTAGTPVRIPTELKTTKGAIRMVTVRFPGEATVGDISNFIFEKFITRKPTYFIHNNVRYAVLKKKDLGTVPAEPTT
jgi:hypothetical protein